MKIEKVVRVGNLEGHGIFCKIKFVDGNLSISGVIGPKRNGDSWGGCGQIDMEFAHRNPEDNDRRYSNPTKPEEIKFAPGWDTEKWLDFLDVWEKWHLNDMRPGCEHQKGWGKKLLQVSKTRFLDDKNTETKTSGWVYEKEHPEGELMKPCPVCGYKYGSAWLKEEVPTDVLKFLNDLPVTDYAPAWV